MIKRVYIGVAGLLICSVASFGSPSEMVIDGIVESSAGGFRFPDGSIQESAAEGGDGSRGFYLTSALVQGDAPLYACATGYHMASLWELLEVKVLEYHASHPEAAAPLADMGSGPPFGVSGWVRTGGPSHNLGLPGLGNCNQWQSSEYADGGVAERGGGDSGTIVELCDRWDAPATAISPWVGSTDSCASLRPVWCIED